jgi:hypothetical protein
VYQTYSRWLLAFDIPGTLAQRQKLLDKQLWSLSQIPKTKQKAFTPGEILDYLGCTHTMFSPHISHIRQYVFRRMTYLSHGVEGYSGLGMVRHGTVSIDEFMAIMKDVYAQRASSRGRSVSGHKNIQGVMVGVTGNRIETYYNRGCDCVECGIKGQFFAIEKDYKQSGSGSNWHFNLYALTEEGKEVLMTRDHILPASKKGNNSIFNSQPMCAPCNTRKGNSFEIDILL